MHFVTRLPELELESLPDAHILIFHVICILGQRLFVSTDPRTRRSLPAAAHTWLLQWSKTTGLAFDEATNRLVTYIRCVYGDLKPAELSRHLCSFPVPVPQQGGSLVHGVYYTMLRARFIAGAPEQFASWCVSALHQWNHALENHYVQLRDGALEEASNQKLFLLNCLACKIQNQPQQQQQQKQLDSALMVHFNLCFKPQDLGLLSTPYRMECMLWWLILGLELRSRDPAFITESQLQDLLKILNNLLIMQQQEESFSSSEFTLFRNRQFLHDALSASVLPFLRLSSLQFFHLASVLQQFIVPRIQSLELQNRVWLEINDWHNPPVAHSSLSTLSFIRSVDPSFAYFQRQSHSWQTHTVLQLFAHWIFTRSQPNPTLQFFIQDVCRYCTFVSTGDNQAPNNLLLLDQWCPQFNNLWFQQLWIQVAQQIFTVPAYTMQYVLPVIVWMYNKVLHSYDKQRDGVWRRSELQLNEWTDLFKSIPSVEKWKTRPMLRTIWIQHCILLTRVPCKVLGYKLIWQTNFQELCTWYLETNEHWNIHIQELKLALQMLDLYIGLYIKFSVERAEPVVRLLWKLMQRWNEIEPSTFEKTRLYDSCKLMLDRSHNWYRVITRVIKTKHSDKTTDWSESVEYCLNQCNQFKQQQQEQHNTSDSTTSPLNIIDD